MRPWRAWWSDDGRWLTLGIEDDVLGAWDARRARQLLGSRPPVLALSLAGDRLVIETTLESIAWKPASGAVQVRDYRHRPRDPPGPCINVLTRDGRRSASRDTAGAIVVHDVGRLPRRVESAPAGACPSAFSFAFSDDGRRLAVGTAQGEVVLWRVRNGEHLATFSRTPDAFLVWGPTGEYELLAAPTRTAGLRCRIGDRVYPLRLCSERFETPGLGAALLEGNLAILDP